MGGAIRRLSLAFLGTVVVSMAVGCGSSSPVAKVTPSPIAGPLSIDLTVTGDLPFAGHLTNAFLATHIPCTPRTVQVQIAEGGTVPVKRFQAAWRMRASGKDYTVFFSRLPYRGPGTYSMRPMPEDKISPRSSLTQVGIYVYSGDPDYDESTGKIASADLLFGWTVTSGSINKTFVVATDETSGTIDADLWTKEAMAMDTTGAPAGHVSGSWRCK